MTLHCGWPSFDEAIPGTIRYAEDRSHGMVRTGSGAPGATPTRTPLRRRADDPKNARYCINSISLALEPAD
jgi:peptide-methionine (R)-S-oxide reductase